MYLDLDPDYPELWRIGEIASIDQRGGLGVLPAAEEQESHREAVVDEDPPRHPQYSGDVSALRS